MKNNKVSEIKDGPRKYVFGDPICDYTLERCETPDIPCSQCQLNKSNSTARDLLEAGAEFQRERTDLPSCSKNTMQKENP
jgi:hypothetical protein